jgi:hypothetical protein
MNSWRKKMLLFITDMKENGLNDDCIFITLKKTGMLTKTANKLMNDTQELVSETPATDYMKQRNKEKGIKNIPHGKGRCMYCGKKVAKTVNFCSNDHYIKFKDSQEK